MAIKLLRHHILIQLEDAIEADEALRRARAAGIHIELDKREKEAVEIGTVVQVGPTAFKDFGFETSPIKEGDKVSLIRYSGKKTKDSTGTLYYIFEDSDILAIIE